MRKLLSLSLFLCLLCAAALTCAEETSGTQGGSVFDLSGIEPIQMILEDDEDEPVVIYEKDGSRTITITATGDFTIGGDTRKSSNPFEREIAKHGGDINYIMEGVRDIFMADDLTIVNFEGTLTNSTSIPSSKKNNEFIFSAPPAYVRVLPDNGVEAVSLENNHVMDHGEAALRETKEHLDEAGIVWSDSENVGVFEVKGIRIAMVSYLCIDRYAQLWERVPEKIAQLKKEYDLVIVCFHWGNEK